MNPRERLYRLLPAIYRIRDYELGDPQKQDPQKDRPLEGLLLAIDRELQILEIDIDHLYENWFIETCDEWVVPYIGDLVSIQALYAASSSETIQAKQRPYGIQERRAYVANTIAYRKRKGTASVLEQLARDVTGWGAKVVEFWDLLALNQNLDRIRTQNKTVDLRSSTQLDLLGTPFESETAYTIQVRPTRSGNGRYNVPYIGLYIWRLSIYPLQRVTARLVKNSGSAEQVMIFALYCLIQSGLYRLALLLLQDYPRCCYSFSPLENSKIQLFNDPQTQSEITQLAEEINLPIPLPRSPDFEGYQGENPAFQIFINGQSDPIPPDKVLITTLVKPLKGEEESDGDDWLIPILSDSAKVMIFALSLLIKTDLYQFVSLFVMVYLLLRHIVAVDPELGRIVFLDRIRPQRVEVSYAYGFSGDVGGGPYEREDDLPQLPAAVSNSFSLTWEIEQANSASANPLAEAIQSWNCSLLAKRTKGIILIRDDATYSGDLEIKIPADRQLIIVAANGRRPHILGNISVQGIAAVDPSKNHNTTEQSKLNLNGLLIEGKLVVEPGNLRWLNLSHCTLVPQQGGLMVHTPPANIGAEDVDCYNSRLKITIIRSICGAIQLTDIVPELEIVDSIVDSIIDRGSQIKGFSAIAAPQAQVKIATTTILGSTIAGNLEASDSIFNKQVTVTRRQTGCVRFCYVPDGSQTPPRYQCQPDLTLEEKLDPLPKAIASLAIENRSGHLFAGTAGDGIYRSSNQGKNWFKIKNPKISEQHITSLIAYAEPLAGTITSQETTVTGSNTIFTQVFQKEDAIIAHNQVRTVDDILSDTNLTVNASFDEDLLSETPFSIPHKEKGKIYSDRVTHRGQGTISSTGTNTTITGENTIFTQVFQQGDLIIANNQIRTVTAINSERKLTIDTTFEGESFKNQPFFLLPYRGQGMISSIGTTITGDNTTFTQVFQVGDLIIANNQIRTVTAINSDRKLTIDTTFEGESFKNQPFFLLPYQGQTPISPTGITMTGENTTFTKVFQMGDAIIANNQIRTVTAINSDRELTIDSAFKTYLLKKMSFFHPYRGQGAISGTGTTIIGENTTFTKVFQVGDAIIAHNQIRTITAINSDCQLTIDSAFSLELTKTTFFIPSRTYIFAGTVSGEVWFSLGRIESWQQINTGSNNTAITDLVTYAPVGTGTISSATIADNSEEVQINQFLAGTAGNGIFSFPQQGQNWHPLNQGLTNLNITALVIGKNQQIFVGTAGGGVFRFVASRDSGKQVMIFALSLLIQRGLYRLGALLLQEYRWEPVNCGLTDLRVTAIAIDEEGTIFVGTKGGKVFVSTDNGDRWSMIDGSPINLKVTALLAYSQTFEGQLESDRTTITVNEKSVALGLKSGDKIVARGQTRTITKVDQENESVSLTIDIEFYSNLPLEEIEFTVKRLIVATAGGGIFTTTSDRLDQQETENLSLLNITTIVIDLHNQQIFAGTSLGSILASQDNGVTWIPRDRGLVNVEQKLALLAQLQPNFTSEKYGNYGYAQLRQAYPQKIFTGAEDGSEMGVFSYLKQPQRQQNLHSSLDDYLRFGLEKSIFYIT